MSVYRSETAQHLEKALLSVWDDQTLRPDEIVLVQDGPLGEDLSRVISSWKEKLADSLVILINKTNLGLTKSLNKAISTAKGEYLARMDTDDISTPRRFELQKKFLDAHPDVSVLGGAIQEFDDINPCLGVRHYPATNAEALHWIHKGNPMAHSTVMIRRSLFEEGYLYNENFRKNQDLELWFRILANGKKIANLPDILVHFRRDRGVFARRGKKSAIMEFQIYCKGIKELNGVVSPKYLFPMARLAFRLMPKSISKWAYNSSARTAILEKDLKIQSTPDRRRKRIASKKNHSSRKKSSEFKASNSLHTRSHRGKNTLRRRNNSTYNKFKHKR